MKPLVRKKSLSEQVAEVVCNEIGEGRFKLGQMISEAQISAELGVSRTPVREAFSRLEFQGLLITKPQSGTYVFDINQATFSDLSQVRTCLELQGFQLSHNNAAGPLIQDLNDLGVQMTEARKQKNFQEYRALDRAFHNKFITHSGNQLLVELYEPISLKINALFNSNFMTGAFSDTAHQDHLLIPRQLAEKQFDQALETVGTHLCRFGKLFKGAPPPASLA